jgi:hypothetical protein
MSIKILCQRGDLLKYLSSVRNIKKQDDEFINVFIDELSIDF